MTPLTRESVERLLAGAGQPKDMVVRDHREAGVVIWEGHILLARVFRPAADARLLAAAPELARALLDAWTERDRLRAALDAIARAHDDICDCGYVEASVAAFAREGLDGCRDGTGCPGAVPLDPAAAPR